MKILDSGEIRKWDAYTIKNEPISSFDLMERAAKLCTKYILGSYAFNSVDIFCGIGNNGGDGLVVARLLNERKISVNVYIVEFSKNYAEDFQKNLDLLPKSIQPQILTQEKFETEINGELIIDAIFGSGLNKPIEGWLGEVVKVINDSKKQIVSIDMPSGLFSDSNRGNNFEHIVKSDRTITFQCPKLSFFFPEYSKYVGHFHILNIGLSNSFSGKSDYNYVTRSDIQLKNRNKFSHKGENGYLTVIGGIINMFGAAIICSKAAFRTGCGYVGTRCSEKGIQPLMNHLPEAVWLDNKSENYPDKTTAIAIGPGLGLSDESIKLLTQALDSHIPLVIDADAITLISEDTTLLDKLPKNSILTPHRGELERLIGKTNSSEDLLVNQMNFSKKYKIFIIQKGAYSKLTCPDGTVYINSTGNPGMASAGMGDALTGIIGSLLAQNYSPKVSALFGMYLHGYAGDLIEQKTGQRGMLTTDLIDMLPKVLNSIN